MLKIVRFLKKRAKLTIKVVLPGPEFVIRYYIRRMKNARKV